MTNMRTTTNTQPASQLWSRWIGRDDRLAIMGVDEIRHRLQNDEQFRAEFILDRNKMMRAVGNFVRILNPTRDIKVRYAIHGESFATGNEVTIAFDISDSDFDYAVGLALHEGSHILRTCPFYLRHQAAFIEEMLRYVNTQIGDPRESVARFCTSFAARKGNKGLATGQQLRRLAHFVIDNVPGALLPPVGPRYTAAASEAAEAATKWYFDRVFWVLNVLEDRRIDHDTIADNPGYAIYYKALYDKYWLGTEISETFDKVVRGEVKLPVSIEGYMFAITNMVNPRFRSDLLPGLDEIMAIVDVKRIGRLRNTFETADLGFRVYEIIAREVAKAEAEQKAKGEAKQKQDKQKQDQDAQGEGEGEGGDREERDDEGSDGGSEGKERDDESEGSGSGDDTEDEDDGEDDESDESGDDDGGTAEGEDSDGDRSKGRKTRGARNEASDKRGEDGETEDDEGDMLADDEIARIMRDVKALVDGRVKKAGTTKETAQQVEQVGSMKIDKTSVGYAGQKVPVKIFKNIKQMSELLPGGQRYSDSRLTAAVEQGLRDGKRIASMLQFRRESRTERSTHLVQGGIDKRLLYSAGFGAENIFQVKSTSQFKEIYVRLSIDCSGSMQGEKLTSSVKLAAMMVTALRQYGAHVVIDTRVASDYATGVCVVEVFNSNFHSEKQLKQNLSHLKATGGTPESLCFEAIEEDMKRDSQGKESYFVNISDGEPGVTVNGVSYGGFSAVEHCAACIRRMEKAGTQVLSYFISTRFSWQTDKLEPSSDFVAMYGAHNAFALDCKDIARIAKAINKKLLRAL